MPEEKNDYSQIDFSKEIPFIRKRFPHLNEEELRKAEEGLRDFVRVLLDSCDERVEITHRLLPIKTSGAEYQGFLRKLEESTSPVEA